MRLLFLLLMVMFLGPQARAQGGLDGRSFFIGLFEGEVLTETDTLFFQNGQLSFASARKYGFAPAAYRSKSKQNQITGSALNRSKLNGTMLWNFSVVADSIYGYAVFDNRVENPVRYRFQGKQVVRKP